MNRNRYGQTAFGHDVVATVNTVEGPTGSLQLRDDCFACHTAKDRSSVIYAQAWAEDFPYRPLNPIARLITSFMISFVPP
jgi:hypothetical protein